MNTPERVADAMTNTSYATSAGVALVGGFSANEIAAIAGIFLAAATFVVNWVYRHKVFKLEVARLKKDL